MIRFLVESCLLTHGIVSVTNEEILRAWPDDVKITWVDKGEIRIGSAEEYLPFRDRAAEVGRVNSKNLDAALEKGLSGALTASGTMAVCARMGIPLAVTCGMGGIGDIREERLCEDLPALRDIPVTLIATSPKDMLDIPATFSWLRGNGVRIQGVGTGCCTGYLFHSIEAPLDGTFQEALPKCPGRLLLLNPIPEEERIADISLIEKAIVEAKQAEAEGRAYHPAANAAFDRFTEGETSQMQLRAIIANARLAQQLSEN